MRPLTAKHRLYAHKGILKWLGENNYTMAQLSEETNIPYSTLKRKIYRLTEWRFDELIRLINVTGRTFEDLFAEEIAERRDNA